MRDTAIVGLRNFAIEHELACLLGHVVTRSEPGPPPPIAPALLLMVAGFLYLAHGFAIGGIATTPLAAAIALVVISDPVFCRLRITASATRDWHIATYSSGGQYVNLPVPRTVSGSNQRRMGDCPVGAALSLH
jgi:hypothetical protein